MSHIKPLVKDIVLCSFCGVRVDSKRKKDREKHFSDHYENYRRDINKPIYLFMFRLIKGCFRGENFLNPETPLKLPYKLRYLDKRMTRKYNIGFSDGADQF